MCFLFSGEIFTGTETRECRQDFGQRRREKTISWMSANVCLLCEDNIFGIQNTADRQVDTLIYRVIRHWAFGCRIFVCRENAELKRALFSGLTRLLIYILNFRIIMN